MENALIQMDMVITMLVSNGTNDYSRYVLSLFRVLYVSSVEVTVKGKVLNGWL